MTNQQSTNQLQIKATDEKLAGVFANMAQVSHTPEEFILDFLTIFPPNGSLSSRIILTPGHMKRLAGALLENVKRFEEQYGEIKVSGAPEQEQVGFRTT
jgi:hypothetical protein